MKDTNMKTLELHPQFFRTGEYEFEYGFVVVSLGFISTFGQDTMHIVAQALEMLREAPQAIDYIQTFEYDNITFWVMSDSLKGEGDPNTMTFLLEEEY